MARGMAGWMYATISHRIAQPNNGGRRGFAFDASATAADTRQPNGGPTLAHRITTVRGDTAAAFA
jgi:hypothetical protein